MRSLRSLWRLILVSTYIAAVRAPRRSVGEFFSAIFANNYCHLVGILFVIIVIVNSVDTVKNARFGAICRVNVLAFGEFFNEFLVFVGKVFWRINVYVDKLVALVGTVDGG